MQQSQEKQELKQTVQTAHIQFQISITELFLFVYCLHVCDQFWKYLSRQQFQFQSNYFYALMRHIF